MNGKKYKRSVVHGEAKEAHRKLNESSPKELEPTADATELIKSVGSRDEKVVEGGAMDRTAPLMRASANSI